MDRIDLPGTLLRFFEKEDHARLFIAGEIRFGLLSVYRVQEDLRRDETEGNASIYWNYPNPIHADISSMNDRYLLCASHPDVDRSTLIDRFGPQVVRIGDPVELITRINKAWTGHPWALGSCALVPVIYNKGGLLEPDPYLLVPPDYTYRQKPPAFEVEKEYRYVVTCCTDPGRSIDRFLTLPVGDCSDICSPD